MLTSKKRINKRIKRKSKRSKRSKSKRKSKIIKRSKRKSKRSKRKSKRSKRKSKRSKRKSKRSKRKSKRSKRKSKRRIKYDGMDERKRKREFEINISDKKDTKIKKYDKCLLINDKCIHKISGPVSFYILRPSEEYYKEFNAPIFILFGDTHWSAENLCNNCKCSDTSTECCYPIYSDDFIKLLDIIGSDPNYPVYFNTESGLIQKLIKKEQIKEDYLNTKVENTPLNILNNKIERCNRVLKENYPEIYNELCPTKNIIWNNVDIREFYDKKNYSVFLGQFIKMLDLSYKYKNEPDGNNISRFLYNLLYFYSNIYFDELKNILNKDKNFENTVIKSLVIKQFSKFETNKKILFKSLINEYYNDILSTINSEEIGSILLDIIKFMKNMKRYVDEPDDYPEYYEEEQKYLSYIKNIDRKLLWDLFYTILRVVSLEVDLYFLLRSFKTPKDSKNPLISIGYLGNAHTINIRNFLIDKLKYVDVYSYNEKDYDRCIEISEYINLNEIIDYYKKL